MSQSRSSRPPSPFSTALPAVSLEERTDVQTSRALLCLVARWIWRGPTPGHRQSPRRLRLRLAYVDAPTRTFQRMVLGKEGGETGPDDELTAQGFANVGAWILGRNMFGPVRGSWPEDA